MMRSNRAPHWMRPSILIAAIAIPGFAQFAPNQTRIRNAVKAFDGTIDVHGVASGSVTNPAGATDTFTSDHHWSGSLKLDTYNPNTGAWVGTLSGTVVITEKATIAFGCTTVNTYTANTSADTDGNGKQLTFNLTFDIGSDTWSIWPSNDTVSGTVKVEQTCAGQTLTTNAAQALRFGPIDLKMGFPLPSTGYDLVGTSTESCPSCGNAASNTVNYTFIYNLKATTDQPSYTVTSIPPGRALTVDGASITGPQTFNWTPGSSHTISAPSPQGTSARYVYSSWSDGGSQTHTITAPQSATTYSASYSLLYLLTTQVSPSVAGSVTADPDSPDGYYVNGTSVKLTATPNCGFQFTSFANDLTGPTNPQSLVMNAPRLVTANFTGAAANNCPPAITPNGILNAASNAKGQSSAAGGLVSIYGSGLAPAVALADRIPLSLSLGGVSVTMNNLPAPLLLVSPGQINAQIPWGIPKGSAAVMVNNNGQMSQAGTVQVGSSSPGIFTVQYGVGQAIAVNPDGTLAAPAGSIPGLVTHPANRGDTLIIYATGLGAVSPTATDGAASTDTLRQTTVTPTLLIGGIQSQVAFSGLSPQFVGVYQINVAVPATAPLGGKIPLQIQMEGYTTSDQVTIAIQ